MGSKVRRPALLPTLGLADVSADHSTIELVSILTDKLGIDSALLAWIANLNLNNVGFFIVGMFVVTWIVILVIWRLPASKIGGPHA